MDKQILFKFTSKFVIVGSQTNIGSSKDGSEDGDPECSDGEQDYDVVQGKIAELNMMKAQLAQLKGIMSAVQNIDGTNGTTHVSLDEL